MIEILSSLLPMILTVFSYFVGIATTTKIVEYRLNKLEKKMDEHNNKLERLYILEGNVKELQHEIIELKKK